MKLDVSELDEGLREAALIAAGEMGSFASLKAIAKKSDRFRIELDNGTLTIEYPKKHLFFRGLALGAMCASKRTYALSEDAAGDLGIMLDCSRNAVLSVPAAKRFIAMMALMGYNELQLYTEDTYEIKDEPYFGYMRGRYSEDELRELDEYAKMFGVELVPCVQTLAHLNQIFRWRAFDDVHDIDDILLVGEEKTYALIEKMIAACSRSFTSRRINIGMDEAQHIGRGKYEDKHGAPEDRSALLNAHLARVIEICKKYGFKPMMWSDMYFRLAFGQYRSFSGHIDPKVLASVPEGITLVYWDYRNTDPAELDTAIDRHRAFGRELVFAGSVRKGPGFTPKNGFGIKQSIAAIEACKRNNIDHVLMTMWGDFGGECSPFACLPALCVSAQVFYGNADRFGLVVPIAGMKHEEFMNIDLANMVPGNPAPGTPAPNDEYPTDRHPAYYMLYNDCIGGLYDALVNEGDGAVFAKHALALRLSEARGGKLGYIFRSQRHLCSVLELKYDLGVRTRRIYASGDRRAMRALVERRYIPMVRRLHKFYKVYCEQWNIDNKPYGLEVQDYRLGGLAAHIERCAKRLLDYADGLVDRIPELDEPMLDPVRNLPPGESVKGAITEGKVFCENASANIF